MYGTDRSGLASNRLQFDDPEWHIILPEIISKEPLGPVVKYGDQQWSDIVRWSVFVLFIAEEMGLNSENIDLVLDYETFRNAGAILGSGGIIAADDRTCIVDLTRSLIAFCQYESCGKCFPCRMGMSHLLEVLERICDLQGTDEDLDLMRNIGENMQAGSLCGHGQLGFNPVASAIKYFPEEFNQHIIGHTCLTKVCNNKRFSPTRTRR